MAGDIPGTIWNVLNPDEALKLLSGDRLSSATINSAPVTLHLEPGVSLPAGDITFNLDAELTVAAFNSEDDKDTDGLLMPPGANAAADKVQPVMTLRSAGDAWLKYRVGTGVKATLEKNGAALGFNLHAGGQLVLMDYRVHGRDETVREAFFADMAHPLRLAALLEDVQQLKPNEAVAMQVAGELTTSVSVSWADVFTGPLTGLTTLLAAASPLAIRIDAGLAADVKLKVDDDFLLVFAREADGTFRAAVKKAASRQFATAIGAKVTAAAVDPASFTRAVSAAMDAVIGRPYAEIERILERATAEELTPRELETARTVARRLLGTDGIEQWLDRLKTRVREIHDALPGVLQQAAKAKVEAAFAYEYSRVSEQASLIDITLTAPALASYHQALVTGNLAKVTEAVTGVPPDAGVALERYLNEETITTKKSWGFTLGIGKWLTLQGRDFDERAFVTRENIQGQKQLSLLGVRGYEGKWIGEGWKWMFDVRADMPQYSRTAHPLANEFDIAFSLAWFADQVALSSDELSQWLDIAELWGVFAPTAQGAVRDSMAPAIDHQCEMVVQLTVPAGALRALLPGLASAPLSAWANSLAAAMPWMPDYEGRRSVTARRRAYAPLWAYELDHKRSDATEIKGGVVSYLDAHGPRDLWVLEQGRAADDPFTFAGLIFYNGPAADACLAFNNGADRLKTAIENNKEAAAILAAAGYVHQLAKQSHHFRALGAYLCECAGTAGVLSSMSRTLTVTIKDQGREVAAYVVSA